MLLSKLLRLLPVSIAIEADENVFQLYTSGVIESDCGVKLDHAVLVVGYETIQGVEAFIVKNSWGATWGDQGYVYLSTDWTQKWRSRCLWYLIEASCTNIRGYIVYRIL